MSKLEVIKDPNPQLREVSSSVKNFDDDFKEFMQNLLETMYAEQGIGIAAIQVGNPIRALIVDIPQEEKIEGEEPIVKRSPFIIVNPEITYLSEEKVILSEGCLSVREGDEQTFIEGEVERPISININYDDLDGNKQEMNIEGRESDYKLWFARCLQHEIDHLNGILFIDKLHKPVLVSDTSTVEVLDNMQA